MAATFNTEMVGAITLGPGWWVALLGWPAIFASVVAFSIAVAYRSRPAAVVGCLLAAPFFAYLSLTPRFGWVAPPAFLLLCVLAWRIKASGRVVVGALALPATSILVWLAFAVLNQ